MIVARRRVWVALLGVVLAALGALAACGDDVQQAARPENVPDRDVHWYSVRTDDSQELLGLIHGRASGPHPAILLVPGTEGLTLDYVRMARELSTRGFDVAFGCWFADRTPVPPELVACNEAPPFLGVVDAAVPDLDALVRATRRVVGPGRPLAVVGFSRGGGIVALRASLGRDEPAVLVAAMVEGWSNIGTVPGEVNVVERAAGITAPVLILHGETDGAVPVEQARALEAALRARGADVEAHYYPRLGHGLAQVFAARIDLENRITAFVCERVGCP